MSRRLKRYTSLSLILSMLLSLIPSSFSGLAEAAGNDYEVTFKSGAHVGNLSYPADNTFINFYNNQVEGFKQTETVQMPNMIGPRVIFLLVSMIKRPRFDSRLR